MSDVLTFCESRLAPTLQLIEALVRAESPSGDKAAVDRCGRVLANALTELGARVDIIRQSTAGDHVRAILESTPGAGQMLLLGHFDTVWPVGQVETMPVRREGDRLTGPGVFDMKAGIAIGLLACEALGATPGPRPRIVMLWTTDEEVGSGTSRSVIEAEARRSDAVLVLEPSLPGGALKTARRGCAGVEVTVRGVAAHAGIEPEKGASAVAELARLVPCINKLQDLGRGLAVNVVQVWGGARANVIPDEAHALVDVRVPTAAAWDEVLATFRAFTPSTPRTSIECHGWFDRPPLERSEDVARLYKWAREVARDLGRELEEGTTGGGSDGNFTAALGVPTLDGLGAVGGGAHALDEHVTVSDVPWRAALLAGLARRIAQEKR
jgi:glutamate carboxypeptidase